MRRKSEIVFLSVCSSILAWMVLSFFDINAHNMTDQDYAGWNFFLIFTQEEQQKEDEFLPIINTEPKIEQMVCRKIESNKASGKKKKQKKQKKQKNNAVSNKEVLNLARIIQAENGGHEDDEALLLTGIVVLKRVKSKYYPDTIMGVISQKGQYSTYADGKFWNEPSKRSMRIAKKILKTNIAERYPDNLVFQAEFRQGKSVYKKLGYEYFCLA